MAIARKGTRIIAVDGRRYRWVVSPGDEPGLGIVVERADGTGRCRLVVWVEHGVVIAPGLVAAVIRAAARQHGWTPEGPGHELTLRCPDPARGAGRLTLVRRTAV